MKTEYPLIPFLEDNNFNAIDTFTERVSRLLKKEGLPRSQQRQQDLLIEFDTIHSPIALSMISESNGFIVDYNNQHDDTLFSFDCYYSEQKEGRWGYKKIFSFTVPQCFVAGDSPERFIESLNPLLPCHSRGKIYFIDYVINVFVIFTYNLKTGEVKKEYSDKKHSFSPLFIGDLLLCGSSLF